jgi:hypothetical protein
MAGSSTFFDVIDRPFTVETVGSSTFLDALETQLPGPKLVPIKQLKVDAPFPSFSTTVAGAPAAATYEGYVIYVTDETGGATLAFSDGTNWRRTTDRAIIS